MFDFYILMHTKKFRLNQPVDHLHEYGRDNNTYPYITSLEANPCHESSKNEYNNSIYSAHQRLIVIIRKRNKTHVTFCSKKGRKKRVSASGLQGDLQLCKPMSLCFLEGPEAGIGSALGKNPKKWPELWDLGFNLKTWELLEPWQWPAMKKKSKNNQSSSAAGLLLRPILQKLWRDDRGRGGVVIVEMACFWGVWGEKGGESKKHGQIECRIVCIRLSRWVCVGVREGRVKDLKEIRCFHK